MSKRHKPKFYIRQSWNNDQWWMICQTSNNVMVADFSSREIAFLVLDFLNGLTWRRIGGQQNQNKIYRSEKK